MTVNCPRPWHDGKRPGSRRPWPPASLQDRSWPTLVARRPRLHSNWTVSLWVLCRAKEDFRGWRSLQSE
eukprot:11464434-Alexandrium_andersonii.AAC.1